MEQSQVNQPEGNNSIVWIIVKALFVVGIIYLMVMYFYDKRDKVVEQGFVEKKPNKTKNKRKKNKV